MNRITTYIQQSIGELRNVTWPTRQQAVRMTVAVIVFSIAVGAFIGLVDYGFTKALQYIITKD